MNDRIIEINESEYFDLIDYKNAYEYACEDFSNHYGCIFTKDELMDIYMIRVRGKGIE